MIGEASRFPAARPHVLRARTGRTIDALAAMFERLAARGVLELDDPRLAAAHFNWLVMSIPSTRRCCSARDEPAPPPSSGAMPTPASAHSSRRTGNADTQALRRFAVIAARHFTPASRRLPCAESRRARRARETPELDDEHSSVLRRARRSLRLAREESRECWARRSRFVVGVA